MINFKLNELNRISPWGREPELLLHWFALTDGDLWLTFGNETIYEYSKEAMEYWENKATPYNDYPLSRFIEDFTGIFDKVREHVPDELYNLTKDLKTFHNDAKKWLDIYDTDEDNFSDFYFDEYDKLVFWTYDRMFDSGHLIGGPHLSFFRNDDQVRIVWDTEHFLENGISLWTAKDGSFEMNYFEFIEKIKAFGKSFFNEMGKQVDLAVARDWGEIKIDKQRLIEEHEERKNEFYDSVSLLDKEPTEKTNWKETEELLKRMKAEVK